jgi:hypothetical protein
MARLIRLVARSLGGARPTRCGVPVGNGTEQVGKKRKRER